MNEILNKLKLLKKNDPNIDLYDFYSEAHKLAESHFLPAKDFFLDGLDDKYLIWRESCIMFLGFHYKNLEKKYIKKIQDILISDESNIVRSAAIGALEIQLSKPGRELIIALYTDPDDANKIQVFKVILNLCGVPYERINQAVQLFEIGELKLSIEGIKKILFENNISLPKALGKIDPVLLSHNK